MTDMTGTSCPKCGFNNRQGSTSCERCLVISARIRPDLSITDLEKDKAKTISGSTVTKPALLSLAGRITLLGCMAVYSVMLLCHPIASNYVGESWLHFVNLPFHEAGHILFSPFGRLIQVMGGTFGQLLIPMIVAVDFFRRRNLFGAVAGLWWLGESMVDVAPYADDARAGQLMLLGGVTGSEVQDYHDWEIILGRLGMLNWDHLVARFFFVTGGMLMLAAIVLGAVIICRGWRSATI